MQQRAEGVAGGGRRASGAGRAVDRLGGQKHRACAITNQLTTTALVSVSQTAWTDWLRLSSGTPEAIHGTPQWLAAFPPPSTSSPSCSRPQVNLGSVHPGCLMDPTSPLAAVWTTVAWGLWAGPGQNQGWAGVRMSCATTGRTWRSSWDKGQGEGLAAEIEARVAASDWSIDDQVRSARGWQPQLLQPRMPRLGSWLLLPLGGAGRERALPEPEQATRHESGLSADEAPHVTSSEHECSRESTASRACRPLQRQGPGRATFA